MKVLILAAAGLIAAASAAQTTNQTPEGNSAGKQRDPNQMVCRMQDIPGSRSRRRECHTRAEWEAMRAEYRDSQGNQGQQPQQQQTYTPY